MLISIVVPVYNVEKYLEQCLESLLGQTYADIEVVCVNDGSKDASGDILARYAAKDDRLRVISQENGGIAAARNRAIGVASGEWLMFVDSDDWIDATTCEKAINAATKQNADVVFWAYVREYEDGRQAPRPLMDADKVFEGEELRLLHRKIVGPVGEELRDPALLHSWGTVWGKLYRREVIGDTKFVGTEIVGSAEDVLLNIEVFGRVKKACYIDKTMYHYRKFDDSFTGGHNARLNERWINLYAMMEELAGNREADFRTALNSRIALGLIGQGMNECRASVPRRQKIAAIGQIVATDRYRAAIKNLPLGYFPLHWKLFFRAAKRRNTTLLYLLLRAMMRLK